jgi:trk system potassium uptake protein TrkH
MAIIIGMAVGGSMSSTGGGFKALRVGVMWKSVVLAVKKALAPPSAAIVVRYRHLGERILKSDATSTMGVIFMLYFLTYVTGGIIGIAYGHAPAEAIFESVSATANSGLSIGITSATMPTGLKLVYMFEMWAGRLEFIAVLVLGAQIVLALKPKRLRVS